MEAMPLNGSNRGQLCSSSTTTTPLARSHVLVESWGYNPLEASDGKAALKICDDDLPQAIVTDLMMPGMNGLEFVTALGERAQKIAIVFVTGQATIDTAVQGDQARRLRLPCPSPSIRAPWSPARLSAGARRRFARERDLLEAFFKHFT